MNVLDEYGLLPQYHVVSTCVDDVGLTLPVDGNQ
jgi:hypothetical protein